MKSILITNAYSYKNKGDAGIILSMIDYFNGIDSDVKIKIMSRNYIENKSYYEKIYSNVTSIKPLWFINNKYNNNKFIQLIIAMFSLINVLFIMMLFKLLGKHVLKIPLLKKNQALVAYIEADLVCSCGGGYLFSTNKWPISIGLYQHLFHIYLGKYFGKKVVMFPQSIGPLNRKLDRFLVKATLKKVDKIFPREIYSYNLLNEMNIDKNKFELLPDIAFTMLDKKFETEELGLEEKNIKIGVTVLDWHWAYRDTKEGKEKVKEYIRNVAETLNYLIDKYNANVYIVPQVVVGEEDSDIEVSEELLKQIHNQNKVKLIRKDLSAKELKFLYGQFDLFIGSRMHSCIFAIGAGVPTIGLSYQPKTTGTFDLINIKDRTLPVENFCVKDLVTISEAILKNLSYEKKCYKKIAKLTKNKIYNSIDSYFVDN
jgi:colanic acid/amylovoran biosynthesis protein